MILLTSPIWGVLLAGPVIDILPNLTGHARHSACKEWQGKYISYAHTQLRVYEERNNLWIVDSDLFQVIGMKINPEVRRKLKLSYDGYGDIPETPLQGFNQHAAMQFLNSKTENPDIQKFKLWFERNVIHPFNTRKA